jgi:hypothetical protein
MERTVCPFCCHHGFLLRRCAPYRPRTKGKVENGVGYVRKNFWPRVRTFTGLTDLNIQARLWLDTVANVRIHGTTHEVPQNRLLQEGLKTFNLVPFEEAERYSRKVAADALISYAANRYSVPWRYVGQIVEVQDERNGRIRIFAQDKLIAEHDKASRELITRMAGRSPDWCRSPFVSLEVLRHAVSGRVLQNIQ